MPEKRDTMGLTQEFNSKLSAFQTTPTHENFKLFVIAAFALNPEATKELRTEHGFPIKFKKGGIIQFGTQSQAFNTVPEQHMIRAANNLAYALEK